MSRTGRPSKLTQERADRFINAIRLGNYIETAATYAGIDRSTVFRWLANGREATSGEYRDFYDRVKAAEAESEYAAVARVRAAAVLPQHWTAAMTFLERRFRDRWARPAGMPEPSSIPIAPPPSLTEEPVTIDLRDRLAGVLEVLDRAGMLHDVEPDAPTNGANGHPLP